ncbi:ribosome silencing factor [Blochmannia endosymbiont of Colobopsis nipponica]|uniref:ribosome silencing factor n=1 Tax=Blochmannia endosymbiont of Colobopsis nipponica TaxID=2681987 RepID=UPI00177E1129|nr:ribosome silencing factor [Blochmannia endosymbiont of Colobopsis nipponica]QOI11129.1 ribosome silencing factor [Blochmannia endosymbiont of Colobopsis nipponica]
MIKTQLQNTSPKSTIKIKNLIIDIIDNLKGENIITINVINKSNITDYLIICTGISARHTIAIANYITKKSNVLGVKILCIAGENTGEWVIIDLGDIILHIMEKQTRKLYELEKLWN